MPQQDQTEVLVVGAGPVGMLAALRLAESGIGVKVIDKESGPAGHGYACALHPHTLKLLESVGLNEEVLRLGHRVDTIAFYEGGARRAELKLSQLPIEFPFIVVLPQSALENCLERKLSRTNRASIHWNHRLADLRMDNATVLATIDKLTETAMGYIVTEWETVVERRLSTSADFVVGADGNRSLVRQRLDMAYERLGDPELYLIYEFEAGRAIDHEMKIVLSDSATSVMWPLSDSKCRWTFQITPADAPGDFPEKDRSPFVIEEAPSENDRRHHLQRLLRERAPWFEGNVEQLGWSMDVQFEHRLANQFGAKRCWLAGDAAHQTGPIGMQSMNLGLREAADLADRLKKILRDKASLDLLQIYNHDRRAEWQRLLGINGGPKATAQAAPWARERCAKIPSCLPAAGEDLTHLLNRLGLELK